MASAFPCLSPNEPLPSCGAMASIVGIRPSMRQGKPCVLFVAPVPPPVHGAALAMQYLLGELRQRHDLEVLHVDSKFAGSLDDIGSFSLKKVFRLVRYAC